MPFTLSHTVAVLPFTRGRVGRLLVPSGLVVGSWVPDVPWFVPPHEVADFSHSALGVVTYDLGVGLLLVAIWELLLRDPVVDLLPGTVRRRIPARRVFDVQRWLAAGVSVLLGAVTHVSWDSFTHADRWGVRHLWVLETEIAGTPLYHLLQWASGVVGLVLTLVWAGWLLRETRPHDDPGRLSDRARSAAWLLLMAAGVAGAGLAALMRETFTIEAFGFYTITGGMSAATLMLGALCVAWQLWRLRQRASVPG